MAGDSTGTPTDQDQAYAQREQRIRERAYQLWQEDGAPEGRADEYWHRAQKLLEDEAQSGSPVPRQAPGKHIQL
jgi:hypothetical protein